MLKKQCRCLTLMSDFRQYRYMISREVVSQKVLESMNATGVTHTELANNLNIPESELNQKLNCKAPFEIGELVEVSKILGIDVDLLFHDETANPQSGESVQSETITTPKAESEK